MSSEVTVETRTVSADDIPLALKMKVEAQEREAAIAAGKSPKDVAWEQFNESQFVHFDFESAKKHLDRYIGYRLEETKNIEDNQLNKEEDIFQKVNSTFISYNKKIISHKPLI